MVLRDLGRVLYPLICDTSELEDLATGRRLLDAAVLEFDAVLRRPDVAGSLDPRGSASSIKIGSSAVP